MAIAKYFSPVQFRTLTLLFATLILPVCVPAIAGASQTHKTIHLRNGPITTLPKGRQATPPSAATNQKARLHLIQFEGPVQPEWREALQELGVDLLSYVPDDTFIADTAGVPPGQLRHLDFIRWVGPYKPEHKVHQKLQLQAAAAAGQWLDISVLVAPRAREPERLAIRRLLTGSPSQSRLPQGTILRGRLPAARLARLAESDAVLWIEPAPRMTLYDEQSSKIVGGDDGNRGTLTWSQQLGFDGDGVVVAVADSGLDSGDTNSMHPDLAGRVDEILHYGSVPNGADLHSHGTHVAGIIAGNAATGETDEEGALYGLGVAPGAHIVSQRIFDAIGGFTYTNSSFEQLTRDAINAGADVGNNSWGEDTQGQYDLNAMEFDALVRDADSIAPGDQPYILEFSAGNAGPGSQTIGTPALAKNVIATGAAENNRFNLPLPEFTLYDRGEDTMADFSSRGLCADGRIKPDVVAPGTWIASLRSVFANDDYAWWPISDNYMYQGGTSQAGPHVAGAAAVFVQYYRFNNGGQTPSPALVKAALVNSAVDMDNALGDTGPVPNGDEGWGRVDLTQIIGSSTLHEFVDQTHVLTNNQVYERRVVVADSGAPLVITLAYTDVPATPAAARALVNDLDLEVLAPNGSLYRGNQFQNGVSVPNALGADRVNNVEGVRLTAPQPGQYLVRVRAYSIVDDALSQTPALDQDFAMAISGNLIPPGDSLVATDRRFYTAPSQILLTVVDPDLAGSPSVGVTVKNTTQSDDEGIVLTASGTSGVFTGVVATATGSASADGILQIAHNDQIQVDYFDASAGVTRIAYAVADLAPPALNAVTSTTEFGVTTIAWTTDEPATSILRYGTNSTLGSSLTNQVLTTDHSIIAVGVQSGMTYVFHVSSADEAGNVATNDNGGSLYTFYVTPPGTVLLIDSFEGGGLGSPPLSGYTIPLDAIGVPYDVWDAVSSNAPPLSILTNYEALVWRVDELATSLSPADLTSISNYLDSGGALFVASMEIFSRVSEVGGSDFIRNVLQVESYLTDEGGSTLAGHVTGVTSDAVGRGIDLTTDYTVYNDLWFGFIGPDISDTMVPTTNASVVFRNSYSDGIGIRWPAVGQEAPGRLVLLSFPLDAVPLGSGVNDRTHLLRNALSFLVPGVSSLGSVALDSSFYPIPGNALIEVSDSDPAGSGSVLVTAFADTYTNGVNVTLSERNAPGVFSGSLQIVSNTTPAAPGVLPAADGDNLWVEYWDASSGETQRSFAVVDAVPPGISGVTNFVGYDATRIGWTTTEDADALVQFGESPLLERSAYVSSMGTEHDVLVTNLIPNRTYYFRVVSRDAARNAAIDDNGGLLYTFTTLTPELTPWVDDLEGATTNWSVVDGEGSQASWMLGTPNNALATNGHSPVNAWGPNLAGNNDDAVQTALASPSIDLSGATSAELRFWHTYDFTDPDVIYDTTELYLVIAATSQVIPLRTYFGASGGWEEEVIDLTPYVGNVVTFVWHYFMFSFDTDPHAGWLVDDISVTSDNVANIRLTNNIAQATFTLVGPKNLTGVGRDVTYTNVTPGAYTVTYGPVDWYVAPAAQSNTLPVAGNLTFLGNYTFADVNNNGMSDPWEMAYFGEVSSNHTYATDFDNDGFTDGAEFNAGTNPTNATSYLHLNAPFTVPNGNLRLTWPAVHGHIYRAEFSSDLLQWTPFSVWLRATNNILGHTFPPPSAATLYRVEVKP